MGIIVTTTLRNLVIGAVHRQLFGQMLTTQRPLQVTAESHLTECADT